MSTDPAHDPAPERDRTHDDQEVTMTGSDRGQQDGTSGASEASHEDGHGGSTSAEAVVLEREAPTGPAVGTLVWGCVVLAVAALLGAWELAGLRLDLSLVVPVGMVVLGVLLVVGAVATAVRSNRGQQRPDR